jgi:ABC-type glycerol-3-phosphate transport system permease component
MTAHLKRITPGRLLGKILILFIVLIEVYPIFFLLMSSFKSTTEFVLSSSFSLPHGIYWQNYVAAWNTGRLNIYFKNSSIVTVISLAFIVVLSTAAAFGLTKMRWKLRSKVMNIFLSGIMIPNAVILIPLYTMYSRAGLLNTYWSLILTYIAVGLPLSVFLMRSYLTAVPDDLMESAVIDGAEQWTIYFKMILPLSLPVLATIALFMSFGYWNDWYQAMLYLDSGSGAKLYTLQAFLNRLLSDINYLAQNAAKLGVSQAELLRTMPKEAARMAIVVVATVPIAIAYPFFQRYFVSGLTVGSVKG